MLAKPANLVATFELTWTFNTYVVCFMKHVNLPPALPSAQCPSTGWACGIMVSSIGNDFYITGSKTSG